ncbi:MAG: hypothetical protein ACRCXT_08075 [Paraclostridium sp.]
MSGDILVKKLYPKIDTKCKSNTTKMKNVIQKCFEVRSQYIHDIGPYDRIPFGGNDIDELFKALGLSEKEVKEILSQTYYYSMANFNPAAAKDEFTVTLILIIRHYCINKKRKEAELFSIYLAFSGKFYPSIHYGLYPVVPPSEHRHVMDYVINNCLSSKFDIKREGSLFNAIKNTCITWLDTYEDMFKSAEDEDIVYLIQQLHNRIKSFMKNIAEVYYEIYNKKDNYMTYDSDSMSEDDYRLADNDSLRIERHVEKTMSYITTNSIDYKLCKMASDNNVKTDEVKSIMESILMDSDNLPIVKELIRLIITDYFENSKTKDVRDVEFMAKAITPKPNSKNVNIIRQRDIVEDWLCERSPAYRKRRSREATKSSYHKSVISYLVLMIHYANK